MYYTYMLYTTMYTSIGCIFAGTTILYTIYCIYTILHICDL